MLIKINSMPSVLFNVTPLTKGRKVYTNALLLNSNRVISFKADPNYTTTRTILYYDAGGSTWELTLNHHINTVATRLAEDETNASIWMNVQSYSTGFMRDKATSSGTKWKVNADRIIYAEDISTTQSYVYLLQANGRVQRLTTSHLVADLSRAYSRSNSLSVS